MNKNLLKSLMTLHGDTNATLSKALGVSMQRLSMKINEKNGAEFTQSQIAIIKHRYGLSSVQVDEIFFINKVSQLDTVSTA